MKKIKITYYIASISLNRKKYYLVGSNPDKVKLTGNVLKARKFKKVEDVKRFILRLDSETSYAVFKITVKIYDKSKEKQIEQLSTEKINNVKTSTLNEVDASGNILECLGDIEIPQDILHVEKQTSKIIEYMQNRYNINTVIDIRYDSINRKYSFNCGGHKFSIEIDKEV